jgi:type I restriction enzyme S subunit
MQSEFTAVHLGKLAIFEMGQSPSSAYVSEEEIGLPFLQGNAEFGAIYPTPGHYCSQPHKLCQPGDVLISVRAPVGELNKADQTYVIGRGLAAVRFTEIPPEFGWHLLNYWVRDLHQLAQGSTFKAINNGTLESLSVLLPPLREQRRIAEILDAADEAIRQTERVIAKLEAVKAGLLHDLLTCGLDEHGRLRDPQAHPEEFQDSPLGRIPREWEIVHLQDIAEKITSGSRGWAAYYSDQGPMFLRIGNLTREHINLRLDSVAHVQPPSGSEGARTAVQEGDVLISITADLGIIGVIPQRFGEAYVNQHIALVRINPSKANPRWVGVYLAGAEVGQRQFYRLNDMGAKAGMNLPTTGALLVTLPAMQEQDRIAALLDVHDARIRAEEAELAKLRQVKRGLMDDLLTGRVRVGG